MDWKEKALNAKIWLLILAVMHMVMGVGGSYAQLGSDHLALIGFFAAVGTYRSMQA